MSSRKFKRYKLLLDEGLHLPVSYPKLNSLHDVLHIVNTKNKSKSDKVIFQMAEKEGRLPVVFNTKHFKPLINKNSTSVISLSTNLTDTESDLKICKVLRNISKSQSKGCLISVTKNGINIKFNS
ncbi:MAG: DUF5615 family PIN-like protein [Candidatus Daviesbacteria bacterium]|nr:DUF5615 family PIN-like protein [Candidatus Daviesbacteria bacterium]